MFTRFQTNFSLASRLKITSNICFSTPLSQYIDLLASYNQMHNEAMVICVLNMVAVMCENSKIYRANKFSLPMNLYNLVVARSCKMFPHENFLMKIFLLFQHMESLLFQIQSDNPLIVQFSIEHQNSSQFRRMNKYRIKLFILMKTLQLVYSVVYVVVRVF